MVERANKKQDKREMPVHLPKRHQRLSRIIHPQSEASSILWVNPFPVSYDVSTEDKSPAFFAQFVKHINTSFLHIASQCYPLAGLPASDMAGTKKPVEAGYGLVFFFDGKGRGGDVSSPKGDAAPQIALQSYIMLLYNNNKYY